jgi:hypothetical protein
MGCLPHTSGHLTTSPHRSFVLSRDLGPRSGLPKQLAASKRCADGSGGGWQPPSAPFRYLIAGPLTPAATAVRLRTKSPGHGLAPFLARTKYRRPFPRSPRGRDLLFAALMDWARTRWLSQLASVLWRSARGKAPTRFAFCLSSYFCSFWTCLLLDLSRDCGSGFAAQGIRGEWMPHRGGSRTPGKRCSVSSFTLTRKRGRSRQIGRVQTRPRHYWPTIRPPLGHYTPTARLL